MTIRPARKSDKEEILTFCIGTFNWGDYVDRVWDYWFKTGRLFVVAEKGKRVAMSHAAICPNHKSIWLEGLRVHPDYRRARIATLLLNKMMEYGKQNGAIQASAIVDVTNAASQRMMEKSGFTIVSKWVYYDVSRVKKSKTSAKLATISDLDEVWEYLEHSKIFGLSARRYVKSWHWYTLDIRALKSFITDKSVIIAGRPIKAVAILNQHGYWDKKNVMQIVYLDAVSANSLGSVLSFASGIYIEGGFEEFQLICHDSQIITSFIQKVMSKDREQFLLYNKVLAAKAAS